MELKKSVKLAGLKPEMIPALMVVNEVYAKYNYDCVVTSCMDGKHSKGSRHYLGMALDFRMNTVHEIDQAKITEVVKERLTDEYYVLLEGVGTPNAHLHVQFSPV